jgi:SAM-dependent methyltransferase
MGIVKMAARVIKANISSIVWLYLLSAVLLFYVSIEPPAKPGPAITSQHYSVNTERLLDPRNFVSIVWESREAAESRDLVRAAGSALARSFVQLQRDDTTDKFLEDCNVTSWQGRLDISIRIKQSILLQKLGGWSRTDANAYLRRFSLFVASRPQLVTLLQGVITPKKTLLDVGAGSGTATAVVASAFGLSASDVTALEDSAPLRRLLAARGYRALATLEEAAGSSYGAVALLNVLDSCDDPKGLLRGATSLLAPNGLVLLESVLPFCPRVYKGKWNRVDAFRPPNTPLNISKAFRCRGVKHGTNVRLFEVAAAGFVAAAMDGLNLELVAWTRLPYISSGNAVRSHVVLDSALFVLRVRDSDGETAKQTCETTVGGQTCEGTTTDEE